MQSSAKLPLTFSGRVSSKCEYTFLWRRVLSLAMDDADGDIEAGKKYLTEDSQDFRDVCSLAGIPHERALGAFRSRYRYRWH